MKMKNKTPYKYQILGKWHLFNRNDNLDETFEEEGLASDSLEEILEKAEKSKSQEDTYIVEIIKVVKPKVPVLEKEIIDYE